MKVDVSTEGYKKKLAFTVPADKVQTELENAFRALSRSVRLPGFRPGKAPRKVLEARFGPRVRADVANDLINASYRDALTEHDIQAIGQPQLDHADELTPRMDFQFTISVEVRPEIELDNYVGVEVAYPKVVVTDEEVEDAVRGRLEGQSRLVEVTDRPAQEGDFVLVELIAKDGEEEVAHEQGTMIRSAGDPYYPGVEPLLMGLSVGEEKTGEVQYSEEARIEEIKGRTLQTTVKVLGIQSNQVPELTDEIAQELGYDGGAEGMRSAIRAQMHESRDELARNQARANLLEKLIEVNPFDVPASMIEQSLEMLVNELRMQQAYRTGRDPRTISFSDAVMTDLRARATFAAKAALVLEFVSKKENITVGDEDFEAKYRELADMRGQTVEAVKGYFVGEDAVEELRDRILEEKTLEWLLERSNLVETDAPAEPASGLAKVAEEIVQEQVAKRAKRKEAPANAEEPTAEAPAEEAPAEEAAAAGEVDLSILDLPIGKLKEALATGDHDTHLDALEAAEQAGKARKGALDAIAARR